MRVSGRGRWDLNVLWANVPTAQSHIRRGHNRGAHAPHIIASLARAKWTILVVILGMMPVASFLPSYTTTTTTSTTTQAPTSLSTRRSKPIWNATYTDKLKHDLLLGYDKFARPSEHYNTTEVDLYMSIKHVSLDEFSSLFTVDAWLKMFWNDDKLQWNASQYGNLTTLHMAGHEIWQPDIVLYNSAAAGLTVSQYDTTQMVVTYDGRVLWVPLMQLQAYCSLDLSYWPFDEHTCELLMGSWVYHSNHLDIKVHNESIVAELHIDSGEWEVTKTDHQRRLKQYACCPEMYVDVLFTISVRRSAAAYRAVIMAPVSVAIILCLVSFLLPPTRAEKIILGGVNALLICIFLMYISHVVPILTRHTPYVVLFYSWTLYLVCLSIVVAIVVLNLSRQPFPIPLPRVITNIITGPAGRALLLGYSIDQLQRSQPALRAVLGSEMQETQAILIDGMDDASVDLAQNPQEFREEEFSIRRQELAILGAFIDRVTFFVLCFIFTTISIVYTVHV